MYPTQYKHAKPCSCNECVYKTRAETSKDESIINGSKIDKLYYNKYLPLRERKLIDKLVRTRAVYDDIRNRILSNVDIDINEEDNIRNKRKTDDSNEAKTIHQLVNLVDKGEISSLHSSVNLHSDCCNCCTCSSKLKISRQPKVHMHIPSLDHVNKYLEHHKVKKWKRANRYARTTRSDSYISTLKFNVERRKPIDKREYVRPMLREIHMETEYQRKDRKEYTIPKAKRKYVRPREIRMETEYQKKDRKERTAPRAHNKDVHIQIKEVKEKKCDCVVDFKKLDKIKGSIVTENPKNRIRRSIRSSVTKIENVFHLKKDSISLFKEKLRKKEIMNKWMCDPNYCMPNECIPADCYEEIKKKHAHKKTNQHKYKGRHSMTSKLDKVICKCKKLETVVCKCKHWMKSTGSMTNISTANRSSTNSSKSTNNSIRGQLYRNHLPFPRECEPQMCQPGICDPEDCAKILLKSSRAAHELDRCFCTLQLKKPLVKEVTKPVMNVPRAPAVASFNIKPKPPSKAILAKNQAKPKNVKCLCEIKDTISTSTQSIKTKNDTKQAPQVIQRTKMNLLPYECEPSFCVPGACDPLLCEERIMLRNLANSHSYSIQNNRKPIPKRAKITSASVTKSPPKKIQTRVPKHRNRPTKPKLKEAPFTAKTRSYTNAPARQVVRIGSSFRFDVEFFKDKNYPDTKKIIETNNSYVRAPQIKTSSITNETKDKYTKPRRKIAQKQTQNNYEELINEPHLKRCFCTLKLHKKAKKEMNDRFSSKETMTKQFRDISYVPDVSSKSKSSMTPTVVNYVSPPRNYTNQLLPYECEPLFCTPGQCDPYVCEKRIQLRNLNSKTFARETNTASSPTNSISTGTISISSRSTATHPARQRQRHMQNRRRYARSKTGSDTSYNYTDQSGRSIHAPRRQAVRIGSSFRFDIEFSKSKINSNDKTITYESKARNKKLRQDKIPRRKARDKSQRIRRQERGQGMKNNKRFRHRERGVGGDRQNFNEEMSQTDFFTGKSKYTATESFLKRCFCTLKLRKQNKNKTIMTDYSNIPQRPMHTQTRNVTDESVAYVSPPVTSMPRGLLPYECEPYFCVPGRCDPLVCDARIRQRNKERNFFEKCFCTLKLHTPAVSAGNGTNGFVPLHMRTTSTDTPREWRRKNNNYLLPYECEPGVCVPDYCDPYQCQKIIDRRYMKNAYQTRHANTHNPRRRSTYSSTSISTRGQQSQSTLPRRKHEKRKKIPRNVHGSDVTLSSNSPLSPSKQRQAVKLSSQVSFNIEFYKNKVNKVNKEEMKQKHERTQGIHISKVNGHTQPNRDRSDKSSYAESGVERCFCTLKFQKKGRGQELYEQRRRRAA